jgi:4-hydroxybenzoate polyprenyltransferase
MMDVETDKINRDQKIPALKFSSGTLRMVYYMMTAIGVGAGSVTSILSGISIGPPVFIFCAGLLYYYSVYFKRIPLTGNLIIAFLVSLAVAVPFIFDANAMNSQPIIYLVSFYSAFAFFMTLSREIIKDCEDIEGDHSVGMNTLPVVIGKDLTRKITGLMNLLILGGIVYIQMIAEQWTSPFPFYYVIIFIDLPLVVSVIRLIGFKSTVERDRTDSRLLKLIMLTGVLSMFIFNYFL